MSEKGNEDTQLPEGFTSPIGITAPKETPPKKDAEKLTEFVNRAENKVKSIFRSVVAVLFRPVKLEYQRQFYWGALILVALAFVSLTALALPWTVRYVTENELSNESRAYLFENKDWLKAWLGFASFVFEVIVAFSIGGILFTEPMVAQLKQTLEGIQKSQHESLSKNIPAGEQALIEIGDEAIALQRELILARVSKMGIKEYFSKNFDLYMKTRAILSRLYPGLPRLYLRFVMLKFLVNFPGGLYGFTAFLMFFSLSVIKVINLYLDSPWLKVAANPGG